jgi:hypothetical protein
MANDNEQSRQRETDARTGDAARKGAEAVRYEIQFWTVSTPNDEEPCKTEMMGEETFDSEEAAKTFAMARMQEGYMTCLWMR